MKLTLKQTQRFEFQAALGITALLGVMAASLAGPAQAFSFDFSVSGYSTRVQQSNTSGDFAAPVLDAGILSGSFETTSADPSTVISGLGQLTSFNASWSGSSVDGRLSAFNLGLGDISGLSYNPGTSSFSFSTPILNSFLSSGGDLFVVGLFLNGLVPNPPGSSRSIIAGSPTNISVTGIPEPTTLGGVVVALTALGWGRRRQGQQSKVG